MQAKKHDRRQYVVEDGELLNWKSVFNGVPQGSVLAHLLFLICINGLDDNITSNVLKFANVYRKGKIMVINNIYKTI